MKKPSKQEKLIFLISAVLIITVSLLSLPYSFCGLLIKDDCRCFCPWWLFLLMEILVLSLWHLFAKKRVGKKPYLFFILGFGLVNWLGHLLIHNYFVGRGVFENTKVCSWYWLINLIILVIFFLYYLKFFQKKSSLD